MTNQTELCVQETKYIRLRCLPACELEKAGAYTVCIRPIIVRKAYFSRTRKVVEKTYNFYPVPENNVRAYHIADAHNNIEEPVKAAEAFGDMDFLILNGDVIEDSSNPANFMNIYEISSRLTKGEKPVIFSTISQRAQRQ